MELDDRVHGHWCSNGGDAAVGGPADDGQVCGERMGDWGADAEGLGEEGGGGEVHPGGDGRGEEG